MELRSQTELHVVGEDAFHSTRQSMQPHHVGPIVQAAKRAAEYQAEVLVKASACWCFLSRPLRPRRSFRILPGRQWRLWKSRAHSYCVPIACCKYVRSYRKPGSPTSRTKIRSQPLGMNPKKSTVQRDRAISWPTQLTDSLSHE